MGARPRWGALGGIGEGPLPAGQALRVQVWEGAVSGAPEGGGSEVGEDCRRGEEDCRRGCAGGHGVQRWGESNWDGASAV